MSEFCATVLPTELLGVEVTDALLGVVVVGAVELFKVRAWLSREFPGGA